ncbi:MAG: hypothetical protein R2875_08160 [Desulfobacterales bacterium]
MQKEMGEYSSGYGYPGTRIHKHPKYIFEMRDIRKPMDDIFENRQIDIVVHTAYVLPPIHDKGSDGSDNKGGTKNVWPHPPKPE